MVMLVGDLNICANNYYHEVKVRPDRYHTDKGPWFKDFYRDVMSKDYENLVNTLTFEG
jgi:hypothetical protein